MKRKLIYSVSICVLAFTLVSAMFVEKPTKIQNINVPDLYEEIGRIPGGPIPANGGPDPFWHVQNNTNCDFGLEISFGIDWPRNPSPLPKVFDPLPGGSPIGITFTDLQNQFPSLTLTPPIYVTHAAVRIKFPGATSWTNDPSYATETSETYTNEDASDGCKCVKVQ